MSFKRRINYAFCLTLFLFFTLHKSMALPATEQWHFSSSHNIKMLAQSQQLLKVQTSDWSAVQGELQRYQRASVHQPWKKFGKPIPVVVGKNGLAWGIGLANNVSSAAPIKKEGDKRTPVGIYSVGPLFGFAQHPIHLHSAKFFYVPLTATSICVDDKGSKYYNQLVDSAKITTPDWHSGEQMRTVAQYRWGSVIQYNMQPSIKGAGSCIFLHRWMSSTVGTAGCIAMEETALREILVWLDPSKKPIIAVFPKVLA